jgi:O-succinylbenzoate synthase
VKIDRIEIRHVRMRLKRPFKTSFGVEEDRDCVIVRIDANGLSGWGESPAGTRPDYSYESAGTAMHVIQHFFAPALVGSDFNDPGSIRHALKPYRGHPMARAGLELALWDLHGKLTDQSLAKMMKGDRPRVEVGVSVGIQSDIEALLEIVASHVDEGYTRVKLKIEPGRDLKETEAVRIANPDLRLQVDANAAYTLDDVETFKEMDEFDLLLIEQPLSDGDLIDHSQLQSQLTTPICLDESILSTRDARQALEIDACRIINIKQARVGGLSVAGAIHDYCLARSVPVWCGGLLETGIGRAANIALAAKEGFVLPGDISATDRYYDSDIAQPEFTLNSDSTIDVPERPGLGVDIIQSELDRATLSTEVLGS